MDLVPQTVKNIFSEPLLRSLRNSANHLVGPGNSFGIEQSGLQIVVVVVEGEQGQVVHLFSLLEK